MKSGGSPKVNRQLVTATTSSKKHMEKSPILNQSRKSNQNLANTMRANVEQQNQLNKQQHQLLLQQQQQQQHKPLVASVVHITPPDENNSCTVSSDDDDSEHFNADKLKTIRNKAAQR